jgi:hypothetical protein
MRLVAGAHGRARPLAIVDAEPNRRLGLTIGRLVRTAVGSGAR